MTETTLDLQLALVCDHAATTPDGKLDVHGAFNDLFAPGFPARQDRMVLVLAVEWARSDHGRFQFRIDLLDPNQKPALTVNGHTDVDARDPGRPPARTRLILPIEDVVFPLPGRYRFRVRIKGQEYAGPTLHLIEQGPDGEAGAAP